MEDVRLRPEVPADEAFLFKLYCSTRMEELAAWGWPREQQEVFLRMQFNGQRHSYRAQFPEMEQSIILLQEESIGRLLVSRNPTEILLLDIALMPEYRNHGIGSGILKGLLREGELSNRKISLHVLKTNPAQRLYTRLGFQKVGEDEIYLKMERQESSSR